MKKRIVALFALFAVVFTANAYAVQFYDGSQEIGHDQEVNCGTNITCAKSNRKMDISVNEPFVPSIITVTYYATLPYYTRLNFPGSGAPVGSMMTRGGAAGDCGGGSNGTTVNVCVSDGSNWRLV